MVATSLDGAACSVVAMADGAGTVTQIADTMTEIKCTMTQITDTVPEVTAP